ncbi:hypothetical protein F441_15821 [Phytophthora nicotianae CJ01A1]|uniref:Uncharacterized protein n=2 Tax=Phytophthora nicotianae TaxID=4792 RepID=W2WDF4_PHYNI|nr:hypothetical protein F441_15821 [Phytophthora nicotianae CJ01A1]
MMDLGDSSGAVLDFRFLAGPQSQSPKQLSDHRSMPTDYQVGHLLDAPDDLYWLATEQLRLCY